MDDSLNRLISVTGGTVGKMFKSWVSDIVEEFKLTEELEQTKKKLIEKTTGCIEKADILLIALLSNPKYSSIRMLNKIDQAHIQVFIIKSILDCYQSEERLIDFKHGDPITSFPFYRNVHYVTMQLIGKFNAIRVSQGITPDMSVSAIKNNLSDCNILLSDFPDLLDNDIKYISMPNNDEICKNYLEVSSLVLLNQRMQKYLNSTESKEININLDKLEAALFLETESEESSLLVLKYGISDKTILGVLTGTLILLSSTVLLDGFYYEVNENHKQYYGKMSIFLSETTILTNLSTKYQYVFKNGNAKINGSGVILSKLYLQENQHIKIEISNQKLGSFEKFVQFQLSVMNHSVQIIKTKTNSYSPIDFRRTYSSSSNKSK